MSSSISYNGRRLDHFAVIRFSESEQASGSGAALGMAVKWQLACRIEGDCQEDLLARWRDIESILRSAGEGMLEVIDDSGAKSISDYAVPETGALPGDDLVVTGEVTLGFRGWRSVGESAGGGLSLTLGGNALGGVQNFLMGVSTQAIASRKPNRLRSEATVSFTARGYRLGGVKDRRTRMQRATEYAAGLESMLNHRELRLQYGGFDRVVRPVSLRAEPDADYRYVEVEFQGRYETFPGETEVVYTLEAKRRDDCRDGDARLDLSGEIDAPDQETAESVLGTILANFAAGGEVEQKEVANSYAGSSEEGASDAEWTGFKFSASVLFRALFQSYRLSVATTEGGASSRAIYSGTVKAKTEAAAKALAEILGGGKPGTLVEKEVTGEFASPCGGDSTGQGAQFYELGFRYSYENPGGEVRAEVTCERREPMAGAYQLAVSGTVSAPKLADAEAFARGLVLPGLCLLDYTGGEEKVYGSGGAGASGGSLRSYRFSFTQHAPRGDAGFEVNDETATSYEQMQARRTLEGSIWADSEAAALAALAALVDSAERAAGARLLDKSWRASSQGRHGGAAIERCPLVWQFRRQYAVPVQGEAGFDIIQADFQLERVGSLNESAIARIPFARPAAQRGIGWSVGRLTVSGNCLARTAKAAREWGQGKLPLVASHGGELGHMKPPVERSGWRQGDFGLPGTAALFSFGFTYAAEFTGPALDGIWNKALDDALAAAAGS